MDAAFWAGRRVFVTGHTGFKGAWLSLWLQQLGCDATGFALEPPTDPSLFVSAGVAREMNDLRGDVRDLPALSAAMAAAKPEIVFHLAAQPLVRTSYAQPVETFATNVLGTVHLLEAVRQVSSVRSVVVVTSDKCYENREWPWGYRESEPLGGHDPYSASKACAELAAAAYRRSFFAGSNQPVERNSFRSAPERNEFRSTGIGTARAGNVLGGGDWAVDRIVPDAIRAFSRQEALIVRRPNAVRPWQHVLEPLRGYLTLAEQLHAAPAVWSGAWNFGPREDDAVPVSQLLDLLCQHWDGALWRAESSASDPHEANLLRLDCSQARTRLGWKPVLALDEAVAMTAQWYREATSGAGTAAVRRLTLAQIKHYQQRVNPQLKQATSRSRRAARPQQAA